MENANIDLIKAVIQSMPLALITISLIFRKEISQLIVTMTISSVTIAGMGFQLKNQTIKELTNYFISAMNESITPTEWQAFSMIISSQGNSSKSTVSEIFNWELKRDKNGIPENDSTRKNLKTLRALRGFGLIIQQDKERWANDTQVVVTEFGKYISKDHQFKRKRLLNPCRSICQH